MNTHDRPVHPSERHAAAVRNSLRWAQDAADRSDYVDALGWINVLESIGEQIPAAYQAKRRAWYGQMIATSGDSAAARYTG